MDQSIPSCTNNKLVISYLVVDKKTIHKLYIKNKNILIVTFNKCRMSNVECRMSNVEGAQNFG